MKRAFAFLAVVAAVCAVSCKKGDTPASKPVDATITAADVTVEVGKTVSVNATTNSTAALSYVVDDSGVYTVDAAGVITGVKAGDGNLLIKVPAVEGKFTAAEKTIKVTVTGVTPPEPKASITIDGEFADWGALEAQTFAQGINDPNSPWEGVEEIRCFAEENMVYYYIKFNTESLADAFAMETPDMHLRLCINTDGEYESGYTSYFLEGYDFIVEGQFVEGGAFVEFDGTLFQRIGSWQELLAPENGLVYGVGKGDEYEICLDRTIFNEAANTSDVPMPMGDTFQTGIRFYYNGWDEFSNVPNSDVDTEAGNGYGYLLRVKFN
ncbi:MAG: hypothetical protein IKG92_02715 [Bacteroidales bacterium]|nr:hypothetical protein [Bacteroidales bacterium]